MWPFIGSLRFYMVFYGLSMIVHTWLAIRLCKNRGVSWKAGLALGLCYTWGMCVGAKILYDILNARLEWHNYLDISYYVQLGAWGGPLAYLAVAVPVAFALARDRRMMLDVVVLALPIPMILAKVACFVNGCCYGAETSVPWAMSLAEGARGAAGIPRHSTPLYEIIVLVGIAIALSKLNRPYWKGTLVAWFVLMYGVGRPLTELFRAPDELRMSVGPVSASQLTCFFAALIAAALLPVLRRRERLNPCRTTCETLEMNTSEPNPSYNEDILEIARKVITAARNANNGRPSSRALLAFAVRLAGSWESTVTLIKHCEGQDALRAISNDCAVIRRCMYDAFLQMKWIAVGSHKDPDKMGQLYLDFKPVENYRLMEIVLSQEDTMSKRLANSPRKDVGRTQLREDYKKVKGQYPRSNGKGVRNHWYPGSLDDLAKDLSATEEYTWLVRANNSSVHTGPAAMFHDAALDARHIELLSEMILLRGLGVLAKHDNLATSESAAEVIAAHSGSLFVASFDS